MRSGEAWVKLKKTHRNKRSAQKTKWENQNDKNENLLKFCVKAIALVGQPESAPENKKLNMKVQAKFKNVI